MLKLRELRNSTHLSQTEFAKQFNLTQGTYSNYENGTTQPDLSVLVEIAEKYQISLDYLIGRKFNNDLGYITEKDKDALRLFLGLTEQNKLKASAFTSTKSSASNVWWGL